MSFSGCDSADKDLIASAKTHLANIKDVQKQIKESPDDEALKSKLKEHAQMLNAVLGGAGDNVAKIEKAVFAGMDEKEVNELRKLLLQFD